MTVAIPDLLAAAEHLARAADADPRTQVHGSLEEKLAASLRSARAALTEARDLAAAIDREALDRRARERVGDGAKP